jgi:hypothetical protein
MLILGNYFLVFGHVEKTDSECHCLKKKKDENNLGQVDGVLDQMPSDLGYSFNSTMD